LINISVDSYPKNYCDSNYTDNKEYRNAVVYIKNDSVFKHYFNKYNFNKIEVSDIYLWNNYFWDEIIDLKFPNKDSNTKNKIAELFEIVKYYFDPREIKDFSANKANENCDVIIIFSIVKDNLFTCEVFFLKKEVQINNIDAIYENTFLSVAYLFYLKEGKLESVSRKSITY